MEIPTNAEIIFSEGLEGKVIIAIPKTKFAILGSKKSNGNWDIWIISRLGTARKLIEADASKTKFNAVIQKTLVYGEVGHYKEKLTLLVLNNSYQDLIKNINSE